MACPSASKKIYKRLYNAMATKYGHLFLCVVIGIILLFIGYLCITTCMFRKSQEDIKTCYSAHIQKTDSLFINLMKYSSESLNSVQHVNESLLVDSLIKQSLGSNKGISESQFKVLSTIITQHYDEVLKMHDRNRVKLQKDSLFLSAERTLLEGQTKNMIDLHLNKIEHEYSNITMWAAILTVIFLVFSFYSIFKMDELIKQGDEGVKEIRRIKKEGSVAVEDFEKESKDKLTNLETRANEAIAEQNKIALNAADTLIKKVKEIESIHTTSQAQLDNIKLAFEEKSKATITAFEESLKNLSSTFQNSIESKIDEFNSIIIETSELLDNIKKQAEIHNNGKEDVDNG